MMWSSNGKNEPSRIDQLLIPQEKDSTIIKFKPLTFVLPTPKDFVLPKKNHMTSPSSNLGFPYFLSKKNLFSLSKTNPTCLEKGDSFILPFLSSFSFLSTIVVTITVINTTAVGHTVDKNTAEDTEAEDRTAFAGEARQAATIRAIDGMELIVATAARR